MNSDFAPTVRLVLNLRNASIDTCSVLVMGQPENFLTVKQALSSPRASLAVDVSFNGLGSEKDPTNTTGIAWIFLSDKEPRCYTIQIWIIINNAYCKPIKFLNSRSSYVKVPKMNTKKIIVLTAYF